MNEENGAHEDAPCHAAKQSAEDSAREDAGRQRSEALDGLAEETAGFRTIAGGRCFHGYPPYTTAAVTLHIGGSVPGSRIQCSPRSALA